MAVGDITAAGTISVNSTSSSAPAAGSVVSIVTEAIGTVSIQLTGTWVGTIVLEGTITGVAADWITVGAMTLAGAPITNLVANGIYNINAAPFLMVRARSTAWTSGVANVALHGAVGTVGSGGGGGGGAATIADGSDTAEGATTDAAVQGDNPGTVSAKLRGLNKSVAAGLPVTQQGTWTVQQGATPTAVGNAWPTKVTDGTNTAAVKAASTAALATDPSVVTAFSPNSPLPTGAATIGAVTGPGAVALATDRTTAAAPFSHQLSDGAAFYVGAKTGQLPTALVGGRLDVNIGASAITQAVSGTVTANAGTGTFAMQATAAAPGSVELSDGSAFYVGAKTGQLPSALVSGRLDVNLGAAPAALTVGTLPALVAGTAVVGDVGGITTVVSATLTRPANTTAYTAGDEMTDTGGLILTLTNAATKSGGSGVITDISCSCSSNAATKPSLELWLFDTTSTPQTDNAAFAPSDAVVNTVLEIIPLNLSYVGDATANTGNFVLSSGPLNIPFVTSGSANLFLRVVVRNAYTAGANSDTYLFRTKILQDA